MIGVDEVGRGCLAGPLLVVAARAKSQLPEGLRDSKLMSRKQRQEMLNLLSVCCDFGEGWVKVSEIDRAGLAQSLRLGISRALNNLNARADEEIIMDGKVNYSPKKFNNVQCIVDGDNLVPIVSAASVYAKVKRDNFMFRLSKKYPQYNFQNHVGYGTRAHYEALKKYGVLKSVHRTSYLPISKMLEFSI